MKILKALVLISIFFTSCVTDEVKLKHPIVNMWEIEDVYHDDIIQPVWQGLNFAFTQTSENSGLYQLPLTPYDTVWKSSGTWKLKSPGLIIFDNDIHAGFDVNENELRFHANLPWTATSTCFGDICLTVVTGDWKFKLKRKENNE